LEFSVPSTYKNVTQLHGNTSYDGNYYSLYGKVYISTLCVLSFNVFSFTEAVINTYFLFVFVYLYKDKCGTILIGRYITSIKAISNYLISIVTTVLRGKILYLYIIYMIRHEVANIHVQDCIELLKSL